MPTVTQDGIPWREFVQKQNPTIYEPEEPDPRFFPYNQPSYLARAKSEVYREPPQPPPSSSSDPPLEFPHSSPSSLRSSPAPLSDTPPNPAAEARRTDIENAFDLLEQILHPESVRRMTPREALAHPFLRSSPSPSSSSRRVGMGEDGDEYIDIDAHEEDDDEYVPHPYDGGEGRCREYHFRDEVTDVECVRMVAKCECDDCQEEAAHSDGDGHEGYYEEVRALVAGEGVAIGRNPCEFHTNLAEWGWI